MGGVMDATGYSDTPALGYLRRQALIVDFGEVLLNNPTLPKIYQDAVAKIAEGTGADHSRMVRYRAETDDMQVCAGIGWRDGVVGSTVSATANTPAGRSLRTGMPVLVEDIRNDARFGPDEMLERHGVVSLINVPIKTDESVYGSLEIDSDAKRFSADDLPFLQVIAHLTSLSLMRNHAQADAAAAARTAASSAAGRALDLRELKHRMANNLQAIMWALNVEMRKTNDAAVRDALQRVVRRVSGIGKAEASLAAAENSDGADLHIFLAGLCAAIPMPAGVRIVTDLLPVRAERRTGLPIGLIVNEAVTNSVKHAFPGGHGRITVSLRSISETRARVSIQDDGVGLFDNWQPGSGTDIMNALAHNFGATIVRSSGPCSGTAVVVEFPTHAEHEQHLTLQRDTDKTARQGDE
jgi:two-component system, sensor histidine kinase PdtaS